MYFFGTFCIYVANLKCSTIGGGHLSQWPVNYDGHLGLIISKNVFFLV